MFYLDRSSFTFFRCWNRWWLGPLWLYAFLGAGIKFSLASTWSGSLMQSRRLLSHSLDCFLTSVYHRYNAFFANICVYNICFLTNGTTNSYVCQVAEISQILMSVGIFVGTTFLRYSWSTPLILRPLSQV